MTEFIARHAFTMEDQEAFARMSGDRNPIHINASVARRTQAGEAAVHGVHLLLWAMENLDRVGVHLARLRGGKAKFTSFVPVGRPVSLNVVKTDEAVVSITVACDGAPAMTLHLDFAGDLVQRTARPAAAASIPSEPHDPDFSLIQGTAGCLRASAEARQQSELMFPATSRALGSGAVRDFALMSSLVGMFVPGLNSILSEISFGVIEGELPDRYLDYAVTRTDDRFRLVEMKAEGARISGRVFAFARVPAPTAPTMQQARSLVAPGEFLGRRAFVIGGSRGLGAATCVLLAAGGASVTLTYRDGHEDAAKLAGDIRETCGERNCTFLRYDVGANASEQISAVEPNFTHAYYFATPRIFDSGSNLFRRNRFDEFLSIYVDGFFDFVSALLRVQGSIPMEVLYPSSIAVMQRPRRMTEYAMAKAAGEILCADLARAFPCLTIRVPRLQRVATGQTATVPPVSAADPAATMLPLLRQQSPSVVGLR